MRSVSNQIRDYAHREITDRASWNTRPAAYARILNEVRWSLLIQLPGSLRSVKLEARSNG